MKLPLSFITAIVAVNLPQVNGMANLVINPAVIGKLSFFPDLESLSKAFPGVSRGIMGHDLAFPAMLTFLPHDLIGLVVASILAAHMSTVSSQLNLRSSSETVDPSPGKERIRLRTVF